MAMRVQWFCAAKKNCQYKSRHVICTFGWLLGLQDATTSGDRPEATQQIYIRVELILT